jgi:hypothetical protein
MPIGTSPITTLGNATSAGQVNPNAFDAYGNASAANLSHADLVKVRDISKEVTEVNPSESLFTKLMLEMETAKTTASEKFTWIEEDLRKSFSYIRGGLVVSATPGTRIQDNTVQVDPAAKGMFLPKDMVKMITAAGLEEVALVLSVDASGLVLTLQRGISVALDGAATQVVGNKYADGDIIIQMGSAFEEFGNTAEGRNWEDVSDYNFVQTHKDAVIVSGREMAHSYEISGQDFQRALRTGMIEHNKKIELSFINGARDAKLIGGKKYTFAGGIFEAVQKRGTFTGNFNGVNQIANKKNTYDGTGFNEKWLQKIGPRLFERGNKKKMFVCSGLVQQKIHSFAQTYYRINDNLSAKLGMRVSEINVGGGILQIASHGLFDEQPQLRDKALVVDMSYCSKRYMNGRNTRLIPEVQEKGADGKKWSIESDIGWEIRNKDAHFVVEKIDYSIT